MHNPAPPRLATLAEISEHGGVRLPTERPGLPAGWPVDDAASEVCREYDFGGDVLCRRGW